MTKEKIKIAYSTGDLAKRWGRKSGQALNAVFRSGLYEMPRTISPVEPGKKILVSRSDLLEFERKHKIKPLINN